MAGQREEGSMECRTKATLALPLAILLLGVAVPLALNPGARPGAPRRVAEEGRRAGRTAGEWRELALTALTNGRHDLALRRIKTAEAVDPGKQFARETREIRRAARNARDVARLRERFLGSDVEHIQLDSRGAVLVAYRTVVALPGESLWSIARSLASAEAGAPPPQIAGDDPRIYEAWDRLTDLNGLRELEVGERVKVPLPLGERDAIAAANAEDLDRIARGMRAIERGDIGAAVALHEEVGGSFALATPQFSSFAAALTSARRGGLVETARRTLRDALALPRTSRHGDLVRMLESARDALVEAESLGDGSGFAEEIERIDGLLGEAARYKVLRDGSVVAVKPAGVAYVDAVREVIEWFLGRKLAASGKQFPYYDQKTDDEIGWARYLRDTSDMAEREGVDFAAVLESDEEEVEVKLPNPGEYFAD
jgi:hypothetical protein